MLSFVAGIGPKLAEKIIAYRDAHGTFTQRKQLMDVPGLGAKAFQQSAGFLRIRDGQNPLDATAVHPERYPVVSRMASGLGVSVRELCGDAQLVEQIHTSKFLDDELGEHTLRDIFSELKKPGRDPRSAFEMAAWRDDITDIADLYEGLVLEGRVTNVTHFGAFVDIGVHQDGLVHISELSDDWVADPHAVVQPGQPLMVAVLSIDRERRRIALTAKKAGRAA